MAKTQTGMTDKPALEDKFNIQKYINGLASFIKDCEVPMTIAVQGDWGTGKTSIMEMVRKELTGVKCVWFNTWQYSQFNMGDQLPLILLSSLLEKITEESGHTDAKETAKKALKTIFKMGMTVVSNVTNGATEGVENCLFSDGEEASLPESIGKLKDSFQNAINEICKNKNLDRIVVFVDDLDRLNPGKAVELLEVLKLFLDCDRCVFVLAIDYGVVSRGVSEKYGDLIGEEKGKSFFDKIIQVPFKMPVANYEIKNYIKNCLESSRIKVSADKLENYRDLIGLSVGYNPRGMKRLFNAFSLLQKISGDEIADDEHKKAILFAILCLQQTCEELYNHIVYNKNELDEAFLETLKKEDEYPEIYASINIPEEKHESVANLMGAVYTTICNNDDMLDASDIEKLKSVLESSTITSTSAAPVRRGAVECDVDAFVEELDLPSKPLLKKVVDYYKTKVAESPDYKITARKGNASHVSLKYQGHLVFDAYINKTCLNIDMYVKDELVDDDIRSGKYGNFRSRHICYSLKQDKIDEFNYLIEK
jgi:hypothetical protein